MKLFVCVLALAASAVVQGAGPSPPTYDSGISSLEALVISIENSIRDLEKSVSDARTLAQVNQEKINWVEDEFWAQITLINEQQDGLIESYAAQIKQLIHKLDAAIARQALNANLAQSTAEELEEQSSILDDIDADNQEQTAFIQQLNSKLTSIKSYFLGNLVANLEELSDDIHYVSDDVSLVKNFTASRKCEWGTGSFVPNVTASVYFETPFPANGPVPSVSIYVTGFTAHMDVHSYGEYDQLALAKYVSGVNHQGFSVSASDISKGMVDVKTIYCSWMACQNLDVNFQRPAHE